jgi:L-alanine-DL-glutamate epimerase-like enolase superfamily enzyme
VGKLRWGASGAGSPAGIVYNAISGIEAALWDLVGPPLRRADPPPARRSVP